MPFEEPISRPLTSAGVHRYAPAVSGVYGISNAREWIYIGETDNIQSTHTSIRTRSTPSRAFRECFGSPAEMGAGGGLIDTDKNNWGLVSGSPGRRDLRPGWCFAAVMESCIRHGLAAHDSAFSQRQLFCNYVIQHSG